MPEPATAVLQNCHNTLVYPVTPSDPPLGDSVTVTAGGAVGDGNVAVTTNPPVGAGSAPTRLLRPLAVLGQTAKRIGEGDLAVRARVVGKDEIARLAGEFNAMAERLEAYRKSSLGELIEAQSAMQAAIDSLPDPVVVLAPDGAVLHSNAAAQHLLGTDPQSGRDALASAPPALVAAIERVRRHVLSGHGPYVPGGIEEAVRVAARDGEAHL